MEGLTLDEGGDRWQAVLRETFGVVSSQFKRRQKLAGYKPPGF